MGVRVEIDGVRAFDRILVTFFDDAAFELHRR
jgi:hypothetical protein